MKINCTSCNQEINANFKFCPHCGTNIKCKNCETLLIKDAKFCYICGESINEISSNKDSENINSIKFKENKEERTYEVKFTNETATQVTKVVAGMIPNGSSIFRKAVENNDVITEEAYIENVSQINNQENSEREFIDITENNTNIIYPHINDLPLKYENFSEKDWVLIYSFYLSEFGETFFTRESVLNKYKNERNTPARMKNFAKIWKDIFKENFSTLKGNDIIFTEIGRKKAINLLNRKNEIVSTSRKKQSKSNTSENKTIKINRNNNIKIEEFDLDQKGGLLSIINNYEAKSTKEYILCIGYYINKILKIETFSDGNVDFAFKVLKLPNRPNTLRQIIINIKNNEEWIESGEEKSWKISRIGELEIENKINKIK